MDVSTARNRPHWLRILFIVRNRPYRTWMYLLPETARNRPHRSRTYLLPAIGRIELGPIYCPTPAIPVANVSTARNRPYRAWTYLLSDAGCTERGRTYWLRLFTRYCGLLYVVHATERKSDYVKTFLHKSELHTIVKRIAVTWARFRLLVFSNYAHMCF